LQIGASRHLTVAGSRHDDFVTPRTIRPAAANEMRERVDARGIVAIAVLVRVDLRVKADAWAPEQTVRRWLAEQAHGEPPRQEPVDGLVPRGGVALRRPGGACGAKRGGGDRG